MMKVLPAQDVEKHVQMWTGYSSACCRDEEVIPTFAKIKSPLKSKKVDRILRRTSFALLRERIQDKRRSLDCNARRLMDLHLRLSTILSPLDWEFVDRATSALGESVHKQDTERLNKKLINRLSSEKRLPTTDHHRTVVNLTDERIDEGTFSVLSKGLNFAPAPRNIPFGDIIGGVEEAIRKLPSDAAEEVRSDISHVLKNAVLPKANFSKNERNALNSLRRKTSIVVLPADKGNATVLMKSDDYREKVLELLSGSTYRRIPRDPTDIIARRTSKLIKEMNLPPETAKNLLPQAPVPPRFYGLPKIHKEGTPLRPIVSAINSPKYYVAKYLTGILTPFLGLSEHHVKNSLEFVNTLKGIRLDPTDLMESANPLHNPANLANSSCLVRARRSPTRGAGPAICIVGGAQVGASFESVASDALSASSCGPLAAYLATPAQCLAFPSQA
ncbi:uncharacterized protein LOC124167115 [Ischnura elegans]|uniref:uncharacterized protein LOC124167115 n=1 Tax=Ischnura elegans TaxID=197161 RepID=UPI001ED86A27|nr:uncharacterized protein LOC124167115 [Ischnura elegans]